MFHLQMFARGFCSDHRAMLEAYEAWVREEERGHGADYARRNFLSGSTLITIRDLREQIRYVCVSTMPCAIFSKWLLE